MPLLAVALAACRVPGDADELRVVPVDEVGAAVAASELPLLLPVELVEGWVLDGITSDEEAGVTVRHWLTFRSPEGSGLPVSLCVAASDEAERCRGDDPQRLAMVGDLAGVWHAPAHDATSATEALDAWAAVPLTSDREGVSWIDRSAP